MARSGMTPVSSSTTIYSLWIYHQLLFSRPGVDNTHSLDETWGDRVLGCTTDTQTEVSVRTGIIKLNGPDSREVIQPSNRLRLVDFGRIASLGHECSCLVVLVVDDV
jgi:hypothetical protein